MDPVDQAMRGIVLAQTAYCPKHLVEVMRDRTVDIEILGRTLVTSALTKIIRGELEAIADGAPPHDLEVVASRLLDVAPLCCFIGAATFAGLVSGARTD
jgi:hypothetical protein